MALIQCPECNKNISETADSCPKCGCQLTPEKVLAAKQKQKEQLLGWLVIAAIVVVLAVIASIFNNKSSDTASQSDPSVKDVPSGTASCMIKEEDAIGITRDWTEKKMAPYVVDFDWHYDFWCNQTGWVMRWSFTTMNGSVRYMTMCGAGGCSVR